MLAAICVQILARTVYDATSGEGFITYIVGWILGLLIFEGYKK
jgi:hypothetical protein